MKIALGADHAGFALKESLRAALEAAGHTVEDFGTHSPESTDYPDYAGPVAHAVASGKADRGVLVCSTGIGMSIAANKVAGVRAGLVSNAEAADLTRRHNDANVMTLGAKFTTPDQAREWAGIFLSTPFEGGRHQRRVDKTMGLEENKA
jgi:ribose 5-phosphate isomerase B